MKRAILIFSMLAVLAGCDHRVHEADRSDRSLHQYAAHADSDRSNL